MPFTDQNGKVYEHAIDTICAIGEHIDKDKWKLSGTGFFINPKVIKEVFYCIVEYTY